MPTIDRDPEPIVTSNVYVDNDSAEKVTGKAFALNNQLWIPESLRNSKQIRFYSKLSVDPAILDCFFFYYSECSAYIKAFCQGPTGR